MTRLDYILQSTIQEASCVSDCKASELTNAAKLPKALNMDLERVDALLMLDIQIIFLD